MEEIAWGEPIEIKEAKTFDEQIDLLEKRDMIVEDRDIAKFILGNVNYYRFSAYWLNFKNIDDTYKENIFFNNIYSIYMFDKKLRILLMDLIENIEISFRTYIAYSLGINHGTMGCKDSNNFIDSVKHKKFIEHLNTQKNKNSNKEFIRHHTIKYQGKLPIWVAVEIVTFGALADLYSILMPNEKTFIKKELCPVNPKLIKVWLPGLAMLRNRCAHFGRLYNTNFSMIKIKSSDKEGQNIKNNKVFAYILAMKHLTADKDIWNKFFIDLQNLIQEYNKIIDLDLLGFPEDWVNILSK
ncbi:Abi family protein [Terrisporobacter mayombei]|uniref:Abi family protein n=1 Tax=Terrisporobacter mayombei TaxID=1541 RepID=UPI002815B888|nr:Abi family protein [Terrisporobacter mayombei]